MSVTLTPLAQAIIQQKIDTGHYTTADEVIEEALRALADRDRLARLKEAIAIGDAQLVRGEGIPYTSRLMDEIARDAHEAVRRGEQPSSDVIPSSADRPVAKSASGP